MVWMNEQSETKTLIREIKRNPKQTGWIVVGVDFDCFVWNNNPQLKHLLIALASWVDTAEGKSLEVVKDSKQKCGFSMQVVKDKKGTPVKEHWRMTDNGYTCEPIPEGEETNPFL